MTLQTARTALPQPTSNASRDAHLRLAAVLYDGLRERLNITPSRHTSAGATAGWTLRPDPLHASGMRFDWVHGTMPRVLTSHTPHTGPQAIVETAAKIVTDAGYRARHDGTGLYITLPAA